MNSHSSIPLKVGENYEKIILKIILFFLIFGPFFAPFYSEELNKERDTKITTKVDVETFWKKFRKIREIKYGKDSTWDINFNYCSNWSSKIALSKGEGYVMSKLIGYTQKCLKTLDLMTKYVLEEE